VSWPFGAGARADALNLHQCAAQVFFAVGVFCSMLLYNVFIVALPLSFFVPAWERVRDENPHLAFMWRYTVWGGGNQSTSVAWASSPYVSVGFIAEKPAATNPLVPHAAYRWLLSLYITVAVMLAFVMVAEDIFGTPVNRLWIMLKGKRGDGGLSFPKFILFTLKFMPGWLFPMLVVFIVTICLVFGQFFFGSIVMAFVLPGLKSTVDGACNVTTARTPPWGWSLPSVVYWVL